VVEEEAEGEEEEAGEISRVSRKSQMKKIGKNEGLRGPWVTVERNGTRVAQRSRGRMTYVEGTRGGQGRARTNGKERDGWR
jgi:hypothetical protein